MLAKIDILKLYKNLYKYGVNLKYTDKSFYIQHIRKQFQLAEPDNHIKIERLYKVNALFLGLMKSQ